MNYAVKSVIYFTVISVLCVLKANAQGAGAMGGDRIRERTQQMDMDRMQDRDSAMDSDRVMDRTQQRDREMDRDRTQEMDRDRLLQQERDLIYGAELMTDQEKLQYQNRLRELATEGERIEFRVQHQAQMQQRAKERGTTLKGLLTRTQIQDQERVRQNERQQIYGYSLMTQSELDKYRERLRLAVTEQDREQIRAAHRSSMQQRAKEKGVILPVP